MKRVLFWLCLLCTRASDAGEMQIYGGKHFSDMEQQKLELWLNQSYNATQALLGPFPFITEVYLARRIADEPVPWAYTRRIQQQQVYFQVDSSFELSAFEQDWTAAHEFSHVALPLLDKEDLWFAEGFASFMQYQVLQQQQQLAGTPNFWYQQKLQPLLPQLRSSKLAFVTQLKLWLEQRNYKAAYWGSALFFMEANQLLLKQGFSLAQLIQSYQQQNRLQDQNLQQLIASLDALLDTAVFAPLLLKYQ
ncbi:hypothetical protein EMM73_07625 [Rheinheimera sediminis]|uniref:hypothetical protein n=1 Tax=Rheinheimera sp. YQF-1 TaxID=2499626 RepID=UPI000FD92294|nr:hypothetical protein [Rheinheimera sp. YQF-1]RVT46734.1 hypothetical protein EMM73_07625 [Rheinheimera sp. YQF-1]